MNAKPKKEKKPSAEITLIVRTLLKDAVSSAAVPDFLLKAASPDLLAQAVHTLNKRVRIRRAHTKERAEVRGGGRKPWAQKHTGRSRHGSIRSPLWVGGGTTFGPRSRHERVLGMPAVMKQRAFAGALAQHALGGTLTVLKAAEKMPQKTKELAGWLKGTGRGVLILAEAANAKDLKRVGRNVPGLNIEEASKATVEQVLKARSVWAEEAALKMISMRCGVAEWMPEKKVQKKA